ncbi:MAG: aminopeptidase, partial [Bacillota bacterium]|nr:aminopeptidase [Bacillota bacterium]
MHDPRLTRLARLILQHSMQIKKGDCFSIASEMCAKPLVMALLAETSRIGALARVEWTDAEITRQLLELYNPDDGGATAAFLEDKAAGNLRLFQNLTGEIVIRAYANDAELSQIDPKIRQLDAAKAKPFRDLIINHR